MEITFHYPPALMSLLIDTIPLLCRSKKDTLLFLQGAGVTDSTTADLRQKVATTPGEINKYQIVRTVLTRLNERGEPALRERREVLKRVVEFENFTTCWDSDRLKAQGLVSQIQGLVDVKDSFARMNQERERERKVNIAKRDAELELAEKRRKRMEQIKGELFALFSEPDPWRRGKQLESVLNNLFDATGIGIRQAFALKGTDGEGVIEQIDGVIELDSHLYFVEMKWWKDPVGVPEIAQHMMRVFLRAEARALIISASEYTLPAVTECRKALSQKVVTLCTLQEFVQVLDRQSDLVGFLRRKVHATVMDQSPFPRVSIE